MFLSPLPTQPSKKREKAKNMNDRKTVMVPCSFFSMNEIYISQTVLRTIPDYARYMSPILDYSTTTIANIEASTNHFEACEILQSAPYLLVSKATYFSFSFSFSEVFYKNNQDKKRCLYHAITSFEHLLNTCIQMNNVKLVHLNMHPENLVYQSEVPILTSLAHCFQSDTFNEERQTNLFVFIQETNVFLPLEAHIISFMIKNKLATLSSQHCELLAEHVVARLVSLSCFGKAFIKQYKDAATKRLASFINVPHDIILSINLKTAGTWNSFHMGILFLVLLRDLFPLSHPFVLNWQSILYRMVDLDVEKRPLVQDIIDEFEKLVCSTSRDQFAEMSNT